MEAATPSERSTVGSAGSVESFDGELVLIGRAAAIRELAAHVHAAEARLATMLSEFVADGMWNRSGDWRSLAHWLGLNCGYSRSEAMAMERVVHAVGAMPTVMDRARSGAASLHVVAGAARVATGMNDEQLASVVASATPGQAARVFQELRKATRREEAAATDQAREPALAADSGELTDSGTNSADGWAAEAFWRSWYDDDGNYHAKIQAPAEVGALLDEALAAATKAAEQADPGGNATEPSDPRRAPRDRPGMGDVVRALADLVLDASKARNLRKEGGEHFVVEVLIDLDTLVSGEIRPDSICRLASGPHVTPGLVRRLAGEGTLQLLWHQRGIPLKLGREVRLATRHQRRALRFRDGGCAVPDCGASRHLHAHHIDHYPAGPTDIENLVLLCTFHHRMLHHGGWSIRTSGGQQFEFRNLAGEVIGNRLIRHVADTSASNGRGDRDLRLLREQQTLGIDGDTPRPLGGYSPLTDFALDVLLHSLLTADGPDPRVTAAA